MSLFTEQFRENTYNPNTFGGLEETTEGGSRASGYIRAILAKKKGYKDFENKKPKLITKNIAKNKLPKEYGEKALKQQFKMGLTDNPMYNLQEKKEVSYDIYDIEIDDEEVEIIVPSNRSDEWDRLYEEEDTHELKRFLEKVNVYALDKRRKPYGRVYMKRDDDFEFNVKPLKNLPKLKGGSGLQTASTKPPEKAFFEASKYSYFKKAPNEISGDMDLIVDTPTFDVYLDDESRAILIGVRGTEIKDFGDLKADASIAVNRLSSSRRYKQDKAVMDKVVMRFPPEEYKYYVSGHSLGGAIITQLRRDYPFIQYGVGYNGAFQPADLINQDPNISRLYTPTDFLYNLGGKLFRNVRLVPPTEPSGFFERLKSKLIPSGIRGHSLSNFEKMYGGSGIPIELQPFGNLVRMLVDRLRDIGFEGVIEDLQFVENDGLLTEERYRNLIQEVLNLNDEDLENELDADDNPLILQLGADINAGFESDFETDSDEAEPYFIERKGKGQRVGRMRRRNQEQEQPPAQAQAQARPQNRVVRTARRLIQEMRNIEMTDNDDWLDNVRTDERILRRAIREGVLTERHIPQMQNIINEDNTRNMLGLLDTFFEEVEEELDNAEKFKKEPDAMKGGVRFDDKVKEAEEIAKNIGGVVVGSRGLIKLSNKAGDKYDAKLDEIGSPDDIDIFIRKSSSGGIPKYVIKTLYEKGFKYKDFTEKKASDEFAASFPKGTTFKSDTISIDLVPATDKQMKEVRKSILEGYLGTDEEDIKPEKLEKYRKKKELAKEIDREEPKTPISEEPSPQVVGFRRRREAISPLDLEREQRVRPRMELDTVEEEEPRQPPVVQRRPIRNLFGEGRPRGRPRSDAVGDSDSDSDAPPAPQPDPNQEQEGNGKYYGRGKIVKLIIEKRRK